ncbi:hypothetical protein Lepto7375DRAFT_7239 [Leptolyngbya sp. PCC 7375]|nr:hypothetical protein Lepto7375DRAFT_7239 [Leptolyngbya sp. PCC 7375]
MEQITAYKTIDAQVFQNEHGAKMHELKLDLNGSFSKESAYEKMAFEEVLSWIENNQDLVRKYLELL